MQNHSACNGVSDQIDSKHANKAVRTQLAAAYRGLHSYGLSEGVFNHHSARAPALDGDGEVTLIIPLGYFWKEATPSGLLGINENGKVAEGKGEAPSISLCIHKEIYHRRPDVKCIMHSHMPFASALGCLEKPYLQMIHQNSTRFYDRIAYDAEYMGIADTADEGRRIAEALGNKDVLILCNHGVVTVGKTVAIAFDHMYYLERAAMVQVMAAGCREKLSEIPLDVVKRVQKQFSKTMDEFSDLHLTAIIRSIKASDPKFDE